MEFGKLAEKNHLQRSKMKQQQHVKKLIVPTRKTVFHKQSHNHTNTFSIGVPRRKSGGEKHKCHHVLNKSLNRAFNPDPLNLSALCDNKTTEGTNSPPLTSPVADRSHNYEPVNVQLLDSHDPLNLNCADDDLLKPAAHRRKKRKRRRTATGNEAEELMNILNNVSNLSQDNTLDKSNISIIDTPTKVEVNNDELAHELPHTCDSEKEHETQIVNKTHSSVGKTTKDFCFSEKNKRYRYGNYIDCTPSDTLRKNVEDERLNFFRKEWFCGKQCLDIGCNTGKVTVLIAKHFNPAKILGIDIDANVIKIAKRKAQECGMCSKPSSKFPLSLRLTYGPILGAKLITQKNKDGYEFPDNLSFRLENCVPTSVESLQSIKAEYECILCLNVTKWVQLNFGDAALKLLFKKIFLLLKPGGRLLLEPQSYNSYKKKKKLMPETLKHFMEMKLMPTDFVSYLLSSEVGFATSQCLTYSRKGKMGYDRPLYLLEKSNSK